MTSMPLVIASAPLPEPNLFFQPRPCCSMGAASGSGPTFESGAAPWVLPKVCPPANQRDRFFVVHCHASERLADIARCSDGIRLAIGPFRIHVNQTHLNRAERI